jgi:hypothetical protein
MNEAERHDVINFLIQENKLTNPNYLEIGVQRGLTFTKINSNSKTAVDPFPTDEGVEITNFKMTSDEFFSNLDKDTKYDIIFIDGLHECHQVVKDFGNSLKHSKEGTIIIFDDVYPHNEQEQIIPVSTVKGPCTGDVWKFVYHILPTMKNLDVTMYFFEKLYFQIRGMFVLQVNNQLLKTSEETNYLDIDGERISQMYDYKTHFETYSSMLR